MHTGKFLILKEVPRAKETLNCDKISLGMSSARPVNNPIEFIQIFVYLGFDIFGSFDSDFVGRKWSDRQEN